MRTGWKWLLGAVLALPLAALLALALAIERAPRVAPRDDVSPYDVDRAVAMARRHDPRNARPGQLQRVPLRERDLDLLLHHAARRFLAANTRVRLQGATLLVQASVAAPRGAWLNLELGLRQGSTLPVVDHLRVGRLPLPAALALPLLRIIAARHGVPADALLALGWIDGVTFGGGQMVVSYRIDPATVPRLRAALVAPAEQQRLRAYAERLATVTQPVPGDSVSLSYLLGPLFVLAAERSAAGGSAELENRAALLALTAYANQRSLAIVVPGAYGWTPARQLRVTLQQRQDFALHFLISATLAAEAGTPLADAVGLWKELADARRGGSGFSFNDLAADRAGTRFGELAVRDAARLQARIKAGAAEADFMPEARDLPEFIPEAVFVARYGGVGGAKYKRLMATIEARIDALSLWQ